MSSAARVPNKEGDNSFKCAELFNSGPSLPCQNAGTAAM
jgi:hypothetical protein